MPPKFPGLNKNLILIFIAVFLVQIVIAQTPADTLVHLKGAVSLAEQNYHLLKAGKYEADAAYENVNVVKYSRLPTIEATYQAGMATANNLAGMFYPNGVLPITGPPSPENNYAAATGSAASVLLNWQAVTFGQRNAEINVSVAEANSKNLEWKQDLFNHKINVISAYLDVLLSADIIRIEEQNIHRVEVNLKQSRTLVISNIKAGVDTALFLSELSKAKVDLLNAQRQLQTQQWLWAQLMVINALPVPADTNFLNILPSVIPGTDTSFANHPLIQYSQSQFDLSKSKEQLLKKSYLPKLNIWGTGFARGSGFENNQSIKTWDGLAFSRYNYGAGLQFSFAIMKYGEVKRQLKQQDFLSKASEERLQENKQILTTQQRVANTTFNSTIAIAQETQLQLKSAQYAFKAMQIRYNTGLVNFSDLIQTQYNLLKAELDVKKAYWDAWKALLLEAAVNGNENIFLNEIK
jgi:outer membrane protein